MTLASFLAYWIYF